MMAMNGDNKICPTCGQMIKNANSILKTVFIGGIAGIFFGILFGIWFSIWWFGPGMHSTPMSVIHYFSWGILFGAIGAVIGLIIKKAGRR